MTDIEKALAEALEAEKCVRGISNRYGRMNAVYWEQFAAAILATPSMQAIARQAAIGAAVERQMVGLTPEHLRTIQHALDNTLPGPYGIARSPEDDDPVEYMADVARMTLEKHGTRTLHQVRAGDGDEEVIIAMTGNGPHSEAHAEAIAWLLSAANITVAAIAAALGEDA